MRNAQLCMIMEKLSNNRAQHCPLLVAHHAPETAFPFLWRSPVLYRGGAKIAWEVWCTDEPLLFELFVKRAKEHSTIVTIGRFTSSRVHLQQFLLLLLKHDLPLFAKVLAGITCNGMNSNLSLLGEELFQCLHDMVILSFHLFKS